MDTNISRSRFNFSLKTLLLTTTITGVLLGKAGPMAIEAYRAAREAARPMR